MPNFDGLRIGIVGAGSVALDHAQVAEALGAKVVAGSTRSPDSPRWAAFKAAYPACVFDDAPAGMAERSDIDAVVLSLPWKVQAAWLDWGLSARKPVLIEKPITLKAADLRAGLARHGDTLANKLVGYNRRYYRTVARLEARIAQGGLRAADITISEEIAGLVRRHGADVPPFSMEHSSCHLIDVAIRLFGGLSVVHMTRRSENHGGIAFDCYNGMLETPYGVPVGFFNNANDPSRVGIRCKFGDGTFWCLTPTEILTVYDGYDIIERTPECQVRRYAPHEQDHLVEDAVYRPGFLAQMQAFLSGDFGPGCSPHGALALLDLVEAIKSEAREIQ
jgi:predicted dehydrogenase